MRLAAVFGILILTILGVWACQYSFDIDQRKDHKVMPIALNIPNNQDSSFTFLSEQGFIHKFRSGTEIQIPEGVLMNKKGELVLGSVELNIQEYQDAIDLLLAGVPMSLNQRMAKTAGAFKIEVSQFGEKLFLDPTKNIEIKLACYEKGEDYRLYYLNEKENKQESLYQLNFEMNEEHIQLERSIKRMKPWIKFPLDEDHFAFSYKGILDVIYNKNLTNVSHQMTKKRMQQYGLRWSNLPIDTFIDYNGKQELAALMVWRNISKKPLPDWIKDGKGSLKEIGKDRYRLMVQDSTGLKKFSTQIETVMSLEELFAFGPGFWKRDYESKLKKVQQGGGQLEGMASAFRSFRINRLGVYNFLRQSDEIPSIMLTSHFKAKEDSLKQEKLSGVWYLSADKKGMIYYPSIKAIEIQFFDDPNARIFSVNEQGAIFLYPFDQMNAIDYDQFEKMNQPSFIFKLEKQSKIPENTKELRSILQIES